MNKLLSWVFRLAFHALVDPSLRRAKIRGAIYYLEAIQITRKAVLVLGGLLCCLLVIAAGAVVTPLALCLFMPWQPQTKAIVACGFGAVYLIAPLIVLTLLMLEQRWMRITRADTLMKNALSKR